MVRSDVKFVIYSQRKIEFEHPKVELRVGNFKNYTDIWNGGDVFVFPHKFDGLSLPVQEALSVGMPVLSTAIYPFTTWLPQEWLFNYDELVQLKVWDRMIDVAVIDPSVIAAKIDVWANKDILTESQKANKLANTITWDKLLPQYEAIFNSL